MLARTCATPSTASSLRDLRTVMDELFEPRVAGATLGPAMDAWTSGDRFFIEVDVPGFQREDIELAIQERTLTVGGSRAIERGEDDKTILRERPSGQFRRVFRLPFEVDAEAVEASLTDGVLRIEAARAESARKRTIEISTN